MAPLITVSHFLEENKSGIHIEKYMDEKHFIWKSNLRSL